MTEYKILDNYLIFKELGSDSLGTNYRVGEIEAGRAAGHKLMTLVNPALAGKPDMWKRVNILLDGVKKSNIPHLYSPDTIEVKGDDTILIYPLLKGRTFEQVLDDSLKKSVPINFDLVFSIAMAIADLIDTGASIVVSGKKSFHGFLTPDNIIIDYDGKIYLKNYGIFPYLRHDEDLFAELEKRYGSWLTPEYMRKEKLVPQSDIYHLGYIIYRMLTGSYFSCDPGEDFDAKFSNISFIQHIPTADKEFLTNIITLFKKTLHPDPLKRFASIRDFKDYISTYFKIEELSSVTFSLAYFMNSIYGESMGGEKKEEEKELAYVIPRKKEDDGKLVKDILTGLEEKEGKRSKLLVASIIIVVVAAAAAGYFYISMNRSKKAEIEIARVKQQEELQAQLKMLEQKYQEKIKDIEQKITTTEDEKKVQQEELDKFQKEWQQRKKEIEAAQKAETDKKTKEDEQQKLQTRQKEEEEQKQKLVDEEKKKKEEAEKAAEAQVNALAGQVVSLGEVTVKPVKLSGNNPGNSYVLRKKYAGRTIPVLVTVLVDDKGNVEKIKILGDVPEDIKADIKSTMQEWKYKPAQKDNVNVKVWLQTQFTVKFPK